MERQSDSKRRQYGFGEFLLDPASRALRCGGKLLTLSPKVFDCIVYLVANSSRAIGSDELAAAVWGRADVADVQLRQLMRKVRRVLHDDGGRQAVVRTVPHFGFHWVADTTIGEAEDFHSALAVRDLASTLQIDNQPVQTSTPASTAKAYPMVSAVRIAASACLVAILVLSLAADDRMSSPSMALVGRNALQGGAAQKTLRDAIGVLPVEVRGGADADSAWIRLGVMDLIASDLRNASLPVLPSSNIVALDRGPAMEVALAKRVRAATSARDLVLPSALRTGDLWNVRLDMSDDEGTLHIAQAQSSDIVTAAHDASDRLLALLGKSRMGDFGEHSPSKAQLLQRVEAAMLVDDYNAARRQIEAAPQALRELPELQLATANVDIALHKTDEASTRLTALLDAVSAEANPVLRARALIGLATIHRHESVLAVAWLTEAIGLLDRHEEPRYLAAACSVRGYIHSLTNRYDEALADYARARTAYALANDELGSARVDNGEAIVDLMRGRAADALPLFEHAAHGFERFGALDKLANVLINQISTYLELLRPLDSLTAYEQAEFKLGHYDDAQMLRWLRAQGAQTLAANGRLREARTLLDGVLRAADPTDEIDLLAVAWRARAELDLSASQPDSAIAFAKRTIDILAKAGRGDGESALASVVFIRALRAANQREEASRQSAQLSSWALTRGKPATALRVRLVEAEQAWSVGNRDLAIQRYEQALQIAGTGGTPLDIADVTSSYGNALLDAQDLARASIVIGRIGRWTDRDFPSALLQARLYQALGQRDAWEAALDHARKLAGERTIPADLAMPPREAPVLAEGRGPAPPKFQ